MLTPTKLLTKFPIRGWMTPWSRFEVPVRNANMVPSMRFGVIFANSDMMGRVEKAIAMAPKTTSVKIKKK